MSHETQGYRSAEEGTPCFECYYGHGNCPDAIYGAMCIDYNMISKDMAKKLENLRVDERIIEDFNMSDYDEQDAKTKKDIEDIENKLGL